MDMSYRELQFREEVQGGDMFWSHWYVLRYGSHRHGQGHHGGNHRIASVSSYRVTNSHHGACCRLPAWVLCFSSGTHCEAPVKGTDAGRGGSSRHQPSPRPCTSPPSCVSAVFTPSYLSGPLSLISSGCWAQILDLMFSTPQRPL